MSFYQGKVAKLIQTGQKLNVSYWQVVDIIDVDTNNDENIHLNFSHHNVIRAVFVPVNKIVDFDSNQTKNVCREFESDAGTEAWYAT